VSACCAGSVAQGDLLTIAPAAPYRPPAGGRDIRGQQVIAGATFAMGDHFGDGDPADGEGPVHEVTLAPYLVDETAVTNAAFARFVRATGHVTEAEQLGVSAVFHLAVDAARGDVLHRLDSTPWWVAVKGADWRHPAGPRSSIGDLPHHPVVHVTWNDAQAYCRWAGKRLLTEAEWEYAARGGLSGRRFPWGDELHDGGAWRLNVWQGDFPHRNSLDDGHLTTAPVKSYRPNGYGLFQTVGNVWEWCADWFDPGYYAESPADDPRGPAHGHARVMRGGSYLCHDSYCNRYRVAARTGNTPDSASANVGFRCGNSLPERTDHR
jgi:formylglycine-generating enzyme required for sulfatase activity